MIFQIFIYYGGFNGQLDPLVLKSLHLVQDELHLKKNKETLYGVAPVDSYASKWKLWL